ncbi:autotransporter domain-containing protein [Paraburkholderia silviterrae]|uniref:Autotransporter domain-containing protein n=1 Tax=Paraburkholderia silviterrae TaxID=2528715 RepID=A0A4R5MHQ3_9BURK|nr:autotransporter domain-containing protein [Paraburkholderia silviterrae]TDG26436.1 autotransporter domain-containing protein [Paraburkholderia silviterrae]
MNRFYRVVWNTSTGAWQAVTELARTTGKRGVQSARVAHAVFDPLESAKRFLRPALLACPAVLLFALSGTNAWAVVASTTYNVAGGLGMGGAPGTLGAGGGGTTFTGYSGGGGTWLGSSANAQGAGGALPGSPGGAGTAAWTTSEGTTTVTNDAVGGGGGGGAGAPGPVAGNGGNGGNGIVINGATAGGLTIQPGVVVAGGGGGGGGSDGMMFLPGVSGGAGGAGGIGIQVLSAASDASITLGSGAWVTGAGGGGGGNTGIGGGQAGAGGAGGIGISANGVSIVSNGGKITGGDGASGGAGGAGGTAISGNGLSVTNTAGSTISGGNGASATVGVVFIVGPIASGNGGNGGNALAGNDMTVVNSGTISGGTGANGTALPFPFPLGGAGGTGGAGVIGNNLTITNNTSGVIQGAAGGTGASSGAGIVGSSLTITNDGIISGGTSGGVQASAIDFTGGTNALTIGTNSVINGIVELGAGVSATIGSTQSGATLGPITLDDSASQVNFAGTTLNVNGAISGMGQVSVLPSAEVTLSAQNPYTGATTIDAGGTLALTGVGSIENSSLVDDLGTLDLTNVTGSASLTRFVGSGNVVLGSNSLTITNATAGDTFSGTIGGSGNVSLTAGSEALAGVNTYTGATNILQGATLALTGNGSIASSQAVDVEGTFDVSNSAAAAVKSLSSTGTTGTVVLGSRTLTLTGSSAAATYGGAITGAGGVTVSGGTQTFTGANTYSGGTTLTGGALVVNADSGLGAATGALTLNGGTLRWGSAFALAATRALTLGAQGGTFDTNGHAGSIAQAIAGTGALTKIGAGTLTLSGVNAYTGATSILGGTLALAGAGSIASSSIVSDYGTFDISATTNGTTVAGLVGTGNVVLGARNLNVVNGSTTFDGSVSGTGQILKQGSGQLILNGNSSAFTNTTDISGGTLEVGDIDHTNAVLGGDANVVGTGTLRGHGTILGNVTNSGTVAPGGSIGTLTVNGNYTQASTATLSIEVSPTAASQLKVNGSATLNGVLAITYDPGTYSATQYTVVSAAKGVSGQFTHVTGTLQNGANLGTLTSSVAYDANGVDLVLANSTSTPTTPATPTTPTSTTSTTAAPTSTAPTTTTPNDPPAPTTPVVIAPSDTSIYTALGTATVLNAQDASAALLERAGNARAAAGASPAAWIDATGTQTKVGGSAGEPGFQANRYGFLAGAEHRLGDYTLGFAGGYSHTDLDESGTGDSGSVDTLRAAFYGSRWLGPVDVAATVGYGVDFLSQKRPFVGVGTAQGDHIGQEFTTGAQASLPLTLGSFVLTPRVGLRYAYFHANGFGESGAGGQDLQVGTDNVHSLQPYAEVTLDKTFGDALRPVNVQLRLGYAHELLDAGRAVSVASQDGTIFTAPGTSLPRGYLTTGIRVSMQPMKNLDVSLGYDALINTTHASAQAGSLQATYRF